MPQEQQQAGIVALATVADAISSKIGSQVDPKGLTKIFRALKPERFLLKSLELKSGQNIPAPDKDSKRKTNVHAFTWSP
jgi:hypothetical protein